MKPEILNVFFYITRRQAPYRALSSSSNSSVDGKVKILQLKRLQEGKDKKIIIFNDNDFQVQWQEIYQYEMESKQVGFLLGDHMTREQLVSVDMPTIAILENNGMSQ